MCGSIKSCVVTLLGSVFLQPGGGHADDVTNGMQAKWVPVLSYEMFCLWKWWTCIPSLVHNASLSQSQSVQCKTIWCISSHTTKIIIAHLWKSPTHNTTSTSITHALHQHRFNTKVKSSLTPDILAISFCPFHIEQQVQNYKHILFSQIRQQSQTKWKLLMPMQRSYNVLLLHTLHFDLR